MITDQPDRALKKREILAERKGGRGEPLYSDPLRNKEEGSLSFKKKEENVQEARSQK